MVDLTHGDEYTYLVLPDRFVGDKRAKESQVFSYDVDLTVGGNADIVAETSFKVTIVQNDDWSVILKINVRYDFEMFEKEQKAIDPYRRRT